MRTFIFGEELQNGAKVVQATMVADNRHVVLAWFGNEWAVWFANNNGDCEVGSYTIDLSIAVERFNARVERYTPIGTLGF